MKHFFQSFLGSLTAMLVAGIILMILFFAILFGSIAGSSASMFGGTEGKTKVQDNSVLHITLQNQIVDRGQRNPLDGLDIFDFSSAKQIGLNQILLSLERAKTDDRIEGIFLDLSVIPAGFGTLEEIRNGLIDFKESGKWVVSYSEMYTQAAYYLASVADEIYLYPEGYLDFRGLNSEVTFLKGTLEKMGIEPQIIRGRNNKFKSAVEPLINEQMSEANREQTEKYVGSLWDHYLAGISKARELQVEELNKIADSLHIRKGEDAVKYKLVDNIVYKDDVLANLRGKLGLDEKEDINSISLKKYFRGKGFNKKEWKTDDKVAVIYASGNITSGKGDNQTIGSDRISRAIRDARTDDEVDAIVLRVNSPGGSALASDVIWREMTLASEAKPTVVSMGDLAASGGYYIACAADKIFANPNTITGSIGVFGVLPNMQEFFNDKLGITFDNVKSNHYSDFGDASRPLTPGEFGIIQQSVEHVYDVFLARVAGGREMTTAEVDEIGQGRVWSGLDAKELGLVDEIGGLDAAIKAAAEMADIEDYKVVDYPERKDPIQEIIEELYGEVKFDIIQSELGEQVELYRQIKSVSQLEGIQALWPYSIRIY